MVDSRGGVILTPYNLQPTPGTLVFSGGTVEPTMPNSSTDALSGNWAAYTTGYSVLNFAVVKTTHSGDANGLRMPIGGGNSTGFSAAIYSSLGTHTVAYDGATSAGFTDATVGKVYSPGVDFVLPNATDCHIQHVYTPGGVHKISAIDSSAALIASMSISSAATLASFTPYPVTRVVGAQFYGWAVFYFKNGIPSDINIACQWMSANWRLGKRFIYPGWIGLL